jgi:hypothetical protein
MEEWLKILITAVVSSVSTAIVAEPIKNWLSREARRRSMRQALYREFAVNYRQLGLCVAMLEDVKGSLLEPKLQLITSYFESVKNEALYLELSEAPAFSAIYFHLQCLVTMPRAGQPQRLQAMHEFIEEIVRYRRISRRHFDRAVKYAKQKFDLPAPFIAVSDSAE